MFSALPAVWVITPIEPTEKAQLLSQNMKTEKRHWNENPRQVMERVMWVAPGEKTYNGMGVERSQFQAGVQGDLHNGNREPVMGEW